MADSVIFCDFDGTITKIDTVDHFLSLFANESWLKIEKLWKKGEIGSKECLTRQLQCVEAISQAQIDEFIKNIKIDDYFIRFTETLSRKNIEIYIVSDGFDLFINNTLKKYNLTNIKVFSNQLTFENGKLKASYPFHLRDCKKNSGLCKCEVIKKHKQDRKIIYIGDGTSDICASSLADTLFAKNELSRYCSANNIDHINFKTFEDICNYLDTGECIDVKNEMLI